MGTGVVLVTGTDGFFKLKRPGTHRRLTEAEHPPGGRPVRQARQPRPGCRITSAASCARDEMPSFMKM